VKVNFSQLDRGYLKYREEYNMAAINTLESGWYTLGDRLEKFEIEFASFIGSKYCIGLNSGLDSLILSFRALNIGIGDEVIVPANTYIASVLGITENGATPIFIEPDEYYNLDAEKIEEKITKNTKAILVVHLYGQAANMKKIKEIADKYSLFLIEDCAQSHGAAFLGKKIGSWGDIGCFSFYPTKNLGAFGDGGAIVTDNEDIKNKLLMLRNYGSKVKYHNDIQGINSRLDEIQASLLSVKLKYINEIREERSNLADMYMKGIKNDSLILPTIREGAEQVWHLFVVRIQNRERFQKYLLENGIGTQVHYPIPVHLAKAYESLGYEKGAFPITESYSDTVLSLPLYEGMTSKEINYVIKTINNYQG